MAVTFAAVEIVARGPLMRRIGYCKKTNNLRRICSSCRLVPMSNSLSPSFFS